MLGGGGFAPGLVVVGGGGSGDIYNWQQNVNANGNNLLDLGCIQFRNLSNPAVWLCSNAAGQLVISDTNQIGRVWVTQAGWIGIGAVPGYPLDVTGDVNASGCYRIGGVVFACSDGAGGISLSNITTINGQPPGGSGSQTPWLSDIDAAQHNLLDLGCLQFQTSSSAPSVWVCSNAAGELVVSDTNRNGLVWITQSGQVGIRTATPSVIDPTILLDVWGDASFTDPGQIMLGSTDGLVTIWAGKDGVGLGLQGGIGTFNNSDFILWTNNGTPGTVKLIMTATGQQVGIGHDYLPSYLLDVEGDTRTTGCFYIGVAAPLVSLCNDGSGNLLVNGVPIGGGGGSQTPWTGDIDAAQHNLLNLGCVQLRNSTNPSIWLCCNSAGELVVSDTSQNGLVWITQLGQVGIRTATPSVIDPTILLDVWGDANFTDPGQVLVGSSDGIVALWAGKDALGLGPQAGIGTYNNCDLVFWTNNGKVQMVLTVAGLVGIGPDYVPGYPLDVNGDVNSTGCYGIGGVAFACSDGTGGIALSSITTINGQPPGGGNFDGILAGTCTTIGRAPGPPATVTINANVGCIQSPWIGNINAAGYPLNNAGGIGIGTNAPLIAGITILGSTLDPATTVSIGNPSSAGFAGIALNNDVNQATINYSGSASNTLSIAVRGVADVIRFLTAGAPAGEAMRIASNGYVGIGTSTPQAPLDLGLPAAAGTLTAILARSPGDNNFQLAAAAGLTATANGTEQARLGLYYAGLAWNSEVRFLRGGGATDGHLALATTDTERMRITAAGNVGIGTTTPNSMLEVAGLIRVSRLGVAVTGSGVELLYDDTTHVGAIYAYDYDLGVYQKLLVDGAPLLLNGLSGANVGIAATDPVYPLHLVSTAGVSPPGLAYHAAGPSFGMDATGNAEMVFGWQAAAPYGYWIQVRGNGQGFPLVLNPSGGNVGIGTSAPTGPLDVTGNFSGGRVNVTFLNSGSSGINSSMRLRLGNWMGFNQTDLYPYMEAYNDFGDPAGGHVGLAFGVYNGGTLFEAMRINAAGLLGVGTTAPAFTIDAVGDINVTGTYRVNGVPFVSGGGLAGIQINSGSAIVGPFSYINFAATTPISITFGGIGGPGNDTVTVGFASSSDLRLKRNVQTLTGGLLLIDQLRPIAAEWNGLANTREGQRVVSLIAQELQPVIPDAVNTFRAKLRPEDEEDVELLGYDQMALTCHLILAVQQLSQRLMALETRIN